MAVEKKLQGLHIVLILFIMLSIGLCVSTVMFYKQFEEQELATRAANTAAENAKKAQAKAEKEVAEIKRVGGWDDSDDVDSILAEFEDDRVSFASTYGETPQDVYPKMLRVHIDKYKAIENQLADQLAEVARLNKSLVALKESSATINEDHRLAKAELTKKTTDLESELTRVQSAKVASQDDLDKKYSAAARGASESLADANERRRQVEETLNRTTAQLDGTKQVLDDFTRGPIDGFTAPDGKIIETSASVGVVYVNRGRNDGLRRQTIFQVFDHDAQLRDPSTLTPKAEIEITEIIGPHRAVARVISDTVSDPILPDDLIYSFIFRPGMPERFALAGKLDVDGDGRDDTERLRSLLQINGAKLDAFIDGDGAVAGELSERTRYLVIGDRPSRDSEEAARESFDQLRTQATTLGVVKLPLERFLDYIGLQSDDQRYDLSHQSRDRDAEKAEKNGKTEQPFRKRPERGDDGAF